jgi:hypothetical protein
MDEKLKDLKLTKSSVDYQPNVLQMIYFNLFNLTTNYLLVMHLFIEFIKFEIL